MKHTKINLECATLSIAIFFLWGCAEIPQIEKFDMNTSSVVEGQKAHLSWKVTESKRLKNVEITNVANLADLEGSMEVQPEKSQKYTLRVSYKKAGKMKYETQQVSVDVSPPFFTGNEQIVIGEEAKVFWNVNPEAEEIKLEKMVDNKQIDTWDKLPAKASYNVRPSHTTTYKLYVTHQGKTEEYFHEIEVNSGFFTGTEQILLGEEAHLVWKVPEEIKNVMLEKKENSYTMAILEDGLPTKGNYIVRPKVSTNYLLNLTGQTETKFIHRLEVVYGMLTGSNVIPEGEEAILSWRTSDVAKKVWLSEVENRRAKVIQENLSKEGRIEVFPEKSTKYMLFVQTEDGEIHKYLHEVQVKNNPRPFIEGFTTVKNLPETNKVNFEIFEYDHSNYPEEISFKILATDLEGNFVKGLATDQSTIQTYFQQLTEEVGNKKQTISEFSVREVDQHTTVPQAISLALDYSGSMWGTTPHLETAIKQFVKNKHPEDEVSIIKFDDNLIHQVERETNHEAIIHQGEFEGLESMGGGTALFAGADEAIKSIENSAKNKSIILFTDGQENSSLTHANTHASTAQKLVNRARKTNTKIYPVCFGRGADINLLNSIAVLTGGKSYYLSKEPQIMDVYQEFPNIFHNYYKITYKPAQQEGIHVNKLTYNDLKASSMVVGETYIGDCKVDPVEFKSATVSEDILEVMNKKRQRIYQAASPAITPESMPDAPIQNSPEKMAHPQAVALFDFNKSNIKEEYLENLDFFVKYLKEHQEAIIEVHGHSDLVGTDKGCQRIAEERAKVVTAYFISKGIDAHRIISRDWSRFKPVWFKEDKPSKAAENRRVEVRILE